MKKVYFLFTTVLLLTLSVGVQAATYYYPQNVSLDTAQAIYDGGSLQAVRILPSQTKTSEQPLRYEIGVSKRIQTGKIFQFEILTTETVETSDLLNNNWVRSVNIPNPTDADATATYVVYVKTYVPNNPESENLMITKPFSIKKTAGKDFIELVGGAVRTNNGESYAFKVGPTIYKVPDSISYATSAALSLSFNANTPFSLKPTIHFTKLRSDAFAYDMTVPQIDIASGKNTTLIDLPTFAYEPGVYMGTITLNPDKQLGLIKDIQFQYIVDGPIVTISQITYTGHDDNGYSFSMPVFGKPLDILTPNITNVGTDASQTYKTVFSFMDEHGKELASSVMDVNYASTTHTIVVADSKIKHVASVNIKTYDGDKVFYETTQKISIPEASKGTVDAILWLIISIVLLGLALYLVTRKKKVLILTLVIAIIFGITHLFAAEWTPTPTYPGGSAFGYHTDYLPNRVSLVFNRNLTTEPLACGETQMDVLVKITFNNCENSWRRIFIGADTVMWPQFNQYTVGGLTEISQTNLQTGSGDPVYPYYLPYLQIATINGPVAANTKLYVKTRLLLAGPSRAIEDKWVLDVAPTPTCDRCTNAETAQNAATVSRHGRDYFFVPNSSQNSGIDTLYFAPTLAAGTFSSGACDIDMCVNTSDIEDSIPAGKMWSPTSTDPYTHYSCIDEPVITCACSGRNKICSDGSNTPNATECALQAFCSVNKSSDQTSATFTFSALNVLGSASYTGGSSTVSVSLAPRASSTQSKTVTDSFDNKTSTASCTATNTNDPLTSTSTDPDLDGDGDPNTQCVPGMTCPCTAGVDCPGDVPGGVTPKIIFFEATKIVKQGQQCVFNWATEYLDTCTLGGTAVATSGTQSFITTNGKNVIKTLACEYTGRLGGTTVKVASTTTCKVEPRIKLF